MHLDTRSLVIWRTRQLRKLGERTIVNCADSSCPVGQERSAYKRVGRLAQTALRLADTLELRPRSTICQRMCGDPVTFSRRAAARELERRTSKLAGALPQVFRRTGITSQDCKHVARFEGRADTATNGL